MPEGKSGLGALLQHLVVVDFEHNTAADTLLGKDLRFVLRSRPLVVAFVKLVVGEEAIHRLIKGMRCRPPKALRDAQRGDSSRVAELPTLYVYYG